MLTLTIIYLLRLQDQGAASQDQHLHQDSCQRRRTCVRGHRAQGGCQPRQT